MSLLERMDFCLKNSIKKVDNLIVNIPSYKYIQNDQQIDLSESKICTLIGGNGAGKSTLLESIFSNYIDLENSLRDDEDTNLNHSLRCIAFSSGQNELFSKIFNDYEKNAKRYKREDDQTIRSFYFDYWWSRLLIFFATSLKDDGLVRRYLQEKNYLDEVGNVDTSTYLEFGLRVRKPIVEKIKSELLREEGGNFLENPLYRSLYIRYLEKLVNHTLNKNNDFTDRDSFDRIVSTTVVFQAEFVNEVLGNNVNEIFSFISRASTSWLSNFKLKDIALYFKNDLELDQLSDGEYQLLSIYAMIDLFDDENTIFLFDEVDSHLHYKNLHKLWNTLKGIEGKAITTTHISESILNNDFSSIAYIEDGKIESSLTAREIFGRLSHLTGQTKYEYKIASKIKHIALLDDEVDWIIFKKLAAKKAGDRALGVLNKVVPYKRSSSFNTTTEVFGRGKLEFVKEFKAQNNSQEITTKNFFLICDRDLLPLTQIDDSLSVNINNNYSDLRRWNSTNTYLKSWRMLEIENYLLSKTMLANYNKLDDLIFQLPQVNFDNLTVCDESEDLRMYDAKNILHPLYKDGGFDESKLDKIIDKIPANEISEDIVTMYEFIKDKVDN